MVHVGDILRDDGEYWPHGSSLGGFGYLFCWYLVVPLVSYCSSSSIYWDVPPGWFWLWNLPMTWMSFCSWLIGKIDPCSLWSVSISCLVRSGSSLLPLGVLRSVGDSLLSGGWMILLYNALSPLIIIAIIVFGLSRKVRHALIFDFGYLSIYAAFAFIAS